MAMRISLTDSGRTMGAWRFPSPARPERAKLKRDSPTCIKHAWSRSPARAARSRSGFLRSARRAAVFLLAVLALAVLLSVPGEPARAQTPQTPVCSSTPEEGQRVRCEKGGTGPKPHRNRAGRGRYLDDGKRRGRRLPCEEDRHRAAPSISRSPAARSRLRAKSSFLRAKAATAFSSNTTTAGMSESRSATVRSRVIDLPSASGRLGRRP